MLQLVYYSHKNIYTCRYIYFQTDILYINVDTHIHTKYARKHTRAHSYIHANVGAVGVNGLEVQFAIMRSCSRSHCITNILDKYFLFGQTKALHPASKMKNNNVTGVK